MMHLLYRDVRMPQAQDAQERLTCIRAGERPHMDVWAGAEPES
jgi:hypothetical protein